MKIALLSGFLILLLANGCGENSDVNEEFNRILPVPKEINLQDGTFSFQDTLVLYADVEVLKPLYNVLKQEFKSLYLTEIIQGNDSAKADILLNIDPSMDEESYRVTVNNNIKVTGGSYRAVAMGTVSVLQSISESQELKHIRKGIIYDFPDLPFRGLMIDVARRKHSIAVLKQIVSLCRWYKIHYLQLHLTDENFFSFPTEAYPQLATEEFRFEKDEFIDLVNFANA
ncbi:MAG: glycoside hydrolase family 20 zincin-like fold domain-containing protein, partial [Bacteroidota bacterium]